MSPARIICVVTGSRAEYGLLYWTLRTIREDAALRLQLVVTGMHLSPEFGSTWREIEADGFSIDAKVEMLLSSDTAAGVTKSVGLGVIGFSDAFERLRPDLVLVLGDRFEILAAAQAALIAGIPLGHVHGGELTEGAFDDSIRHSITKMAQIHFVAAEPYRKRVIQMGERPERVINVGAPALDQLSKLSWMSRAELEAGLEMSLGRPLLLVTYHPVTLAGDAGVAALDELLTALDAAADATVVFTYPNADTGGRALIERIHRFVDARADRARAFASLGQRRYLSLMREADVVVGNSSSGIIEAPALRTATVNIGDRQAGRLRSLSVIDTAETADAITRSIRTALSGQFQATLAGMESPYGNGNAAERITETLRSLDLSVRKKFFDIRHEH